jgi:TPR repeat protein
MISYLNFLLIAVFLLPAGRAGAAESFDPKQDEQLAAELRKRYDKGDGDAALRIGNMVSQKRLAQARYGAPVDWYRKGCKLNDASSCHNVGLAYQKGLYGLNRDPAEAAG